MHFIPARRRARVRCAATSDQPDAPAQESGRADPLPSLTSPTRSGSRSGRTSTISDQPTRQARVRSGRTSTISDQPDARAGRGRAEPLPSLTSPTHGATGRADPRWRSRAGNRVLPSLTSPSASGSRTGRPSLASRAGIGPGAAISYQPDAPARVRSGRTSAISHQPDAPARIRSGRPSLARRAGIGPGAGRAPRESVPFKRGIHARSFQ